MIIGRVVFAENYDSSRKIIEFTHYGNDIKIEMGMLGLITCGVMV